MAITMEAENDSLLNSKKSGSYGGTSIRSQRTRFRPESSNEDDEEDPLNESRRKLVMASDRHSSSLGNLRPTNESPADRRASILAILDMAKPTSRVHQSVVLAPEDAGLPEGTALLGSSKLAAQAFSQELRNSVKMSAYDLTELGEDLEEEDYGQLLPPTSQQSDHHTRDDTLETMASTVEGAHTLREIEEEYVQKQMARSPMISNDKRREWMQKAKNQKSSKIQKSFMEDAKSFAEGTIPQSIVIAIVIGIVCGIVAYMYYTVLDYLLELIWDTIPERFVEEALPEHLHVLWIPFVTTTLSIGCGLSIYYLGEPGDLAYTIKCVHEKGYKSPHHILPMTVASLFTILAGGSLGPEAPLVAICAATAGLISRNMFKQTNTNVIRKHTFMGMAGALSAFFGVPLGGSLFAMEVTSRFGVEYFEHLIEAIFAGEICVVVFRSLAGLPLDQIWANENTPTVEQADPYMILLGIAIGLLGGGLAALWANFHWRLMDFFKTLNLLDDENVYALPRVLVGCAGVVTISMLVPQTMFWGEFEFPVLATLSPASKLPHIWPTSGLIGFEMDSCLNCLIVGFGKLVVISFTVAGGYRGGYIFPFFTAGAAFGRALCFAFPALNPCIATLCFAAGINVAITRTALATSLILAFLSGEQKALPAILSASIASLFATGYMPFIKSQIARSDIDFSLFVKRRQNPADLG